MDATSTKAGLFRFLDAAGKQGIYNANTLGALRSAAIKLLEDVEDDADLSNFDPHAAMMRYHNRHPGKLKPSVLGEYERRMKRLLDAFKEFNQNPAAFRPRGRKPVPESNTERRAKAKLRETDDVLFAEGTVIDVPTEEIRLRPQPPILPAPTSVPTLALSYPMRDNFLAQLNVPRDITMEEARRLGAFIATLAKDFKPT